MDHKIAGLIGIARRSGHLKMGSDAVKGQIFEHKAKLVLLAADISLKSEKELRFADQTAGGTVRFIKLDANKDEIAEVLGNQKPVGTVSLDDQGFAGALIKRLDETQNPRSKDEEE